MGLGMIDFNKIKAILNLAGISQLQISFDEEQSIVNADYVFKGQPGKKKITYQEIIDSLAIGQPVPPVSGTRDKLS